MFSCVTSICPSTLTGISCDVTSWNSVLSEGILMKLATNIHHVSGTVGTAKKVSRSKVTMVDSCISTVYC